MHLDSVAGREPKQAVDPGDPNTYWAQARVFAHQDMVFTDPMGWYTKGARDIPHEGEIIQAGAPILTLEASRGTYKETMDELKEGAASLYKTLEESQPAGAL
jgi:predicted ATP-grasp superfamily ATP-dependent carboligase